MDFTQRLKWIENVFNEDRCEDSHPHPIDRLNGNVSQPDTTVRLPVKHIVVFRPEHYEPGYAYPLVIWLHPDGSSEQDLHEIMPQISTRNYLGLSFRAPAINPHAPANGYHWPDSHVFVEQFRDTVQTTVRELKKVLNIHDERIFLAGSGTGCSVTTKLLFHAPQFFAGAALINGQFSQTDFQSETKVDLKAKRVLLDHSINQAGDDQISLERLTYMWERTGAKTSAINSLESKMNTQAEMLSSLNRWIMEGISTARLV